ncbi:MAG: hypothetical protein ACT4QC_23490 [Planctomycetaceae bacterium]
MDKLKRIQKYQFWILLGVALVLPLAGWSVARSALMRETDVRRKALEDLWGKVDTKPDSPNADWEQKVRKFNTEQEAQLRLAWEALYERQKQFMTWPAGFNPDNLNVPGDTEMESRELYGNRFYDREWRKVYQIPRPIDPNTGEGKVAFDEGTLPRMDDWGNQPPTPAHIRDCQEDLWLYRSLLESIAFVNADANSQVDAPIRVISELYLRGGSRGEGGDTGGGGESLFTAGGDGVMPGMGGMMDLLNMGNLSGLARNFGGGAGGATTEGAFTDSVAINPDDELGAEQALPEEGGGEEAESADPSGVGMLAGLGMTSVAALGGQKMDRYVEKKPEWKSRGFYLEVIMDHRKVPNLLVALTNAGDRSGFAIRISRVHQADFRDEDMISASSPGGSMAGMPGGLRGAPGALGRVDPSVLENLPGGFGSMLGSMMGEGRRGKAAAPAAAGNAADLGMLSSLAGSFGLGDALKKVGAGGVGGGASSRGSRTNINRGPNLEMGPDGVSPGARAVDPLSDPMLANVAIDGWLVILNPPAAQAPVASPDQSIQEPLADQPSAEQEAEAAPGEMADGAPVAEEEVPLPAEDESSTIEQDADNRKEE